MGFGGSRLGVVESYGAVLEMLYHFGLKDATLLVDLVAPPSGLDVAPAELGWVKVNIGAGHSLGAPAKNMPLSYEAAEDVVVVVMTWLVSGPELESMRHTAVGRTQHPESYMELQARFCDASRLAPVSFLGFWLFDDVPHFERP